MLYGKHIRMIISWNLVAESMDNKSIYKNSRKAFLSASDEAYSEDGVDLSLIRWMLTLTPTERLQTLQQNIQSIRKLRRETSDS